MKTVAEGSTFTETAQFLEKETGQPLMPRAGYPKVVLLDPDEDVVYSTTGSPDPQTPGQWIATLTVPVLKLEQKTKFDVRWRFRSQGGERLTERSSVIIAPNAEKRETDIVMMNDDATFDFALPVSFDPNIGHTGIVRIYKDNDRFLPDLALEDAAAASLEIGVDRTACYINLPQDGFPPTLSSYMVRVVVRMGGRPVTYTYKLWSLTPQMLKAMTALEDFVNKARVENIIPQLEYTAGDLVGYLERGLYIFNRLVSITAFTGINMQGTLFDAWLVCAEYYAISAQLIAEGQLQFDFSGQGVSLNVDRTPQLEAALGRIEADMDNRIIPFKKELVKQGNTGGDGSNGDTNMRNPRAFAKLALTNMPTTRLNGLPLGAFGRPFRQW